MIDETPVVKSKLFDVIDLVMHWVWRVTVFFFIFSLGSVFGAHSVAVVMDRYVQEHFVCEERK